MRHQTGNEQREYRRAMLDYRARMDADEAARKREARDEARRVEQERRRNRGER